jgi:hypothetical protein
MPHDPTTADHPRVTEDVAADLIKGTSGLTDVIRDLLRIAATPGTAAADAADLRGDAAELCDMVARILRLLGTTPAEGSTNALE